MHQSRIKTTSLFLALFALLAGSSNLIADEGMWPPSFIKGAIYEQMKAKGFKLGPESIYSTDQPSLKDAIVLFGRGCTGEIISNQGLVLTNHHCGFGQIQSHSSVEKDYLKDGFWAKTKAEELPNPGLTVSILVRMEDVTPQSMAGVLPNQSAKERAQIQEANIKKITAEATKGTHYSAQVKPFFGGIQQWLLVYETFSDIRLVGAPPSSIGKFGGDTDNWVWPRHTGDFSLFRIYAGKDNKPAAYAPDNQPYAPKKYLPIATSGIKEGDFTMIVGYPGRTMEYLPSFALELVTQVVNPKKINLRTQRLNRINDAMRSSDANRIRYASTQADIANAWKKWKGELLGMAKADAIGAKRNTEARYKAFFQGRGEDGKLYLQALTDLEKGYQQLREYTIPAQYFQEAVMANEVFVMVSATKRFWKDKSDAATRLTNYKNTMRSLWKDCDPAVEQDLFTITMKAYKDDIPAPYHAAEFIQMEQKHPLASGRFAAEYFQKGKWFDSTSVWKMAEKLIKGDSAAFKNNPTVKLYEVVLRQFNQEILPRYQKANQQVEEAQQLFFAGLTQLDTEKVFYPDANQTFRIAFGQVAGYLPQDGVRYGWQTTTAGIMEKADTEYDFMLEPGLKAKFNEQNKSKEGPVPVAFIASNHSTGGNSGSPVLNANGELIGVNFDRVWEGTMSDYFFDSRICRNITCDIRYIIWVIEKVGNSPHLTAEMQKN